MKPNLSSALLQNIIVECFLSFSLKKLLAFVAAKLTNEKKIANSVNISFAHLLHNTD